MFGFTYKLIWNTLDLIFFENFPNCFTEQELLPFLIKDGNVHTKDPSSLQINTEIASQLDFLSTMITWATPVNRSIFHIVDEMHSIQCMVTEKRSVKNKNTMILFINLKNKHFLLFRVQVLPMLEPQKVYFILNILNFQLQPALL